MNKLLQAVHYSLSKKNWITNFYHLTAQLFVPDWERGLAQRGVPGG